MQRGVSVSFLMFVEHPGHEDLFAPQVFDGLLDNPTKDVAGELAFGVMSLFGGHFVIPTSDKPQ
jgi:hypothetical protein